MSTQIVIPGYALFHNDRKYPCLFHVAGHQFPLFSRKQILQIIHDNGFRHLLLLDGNVRYMMDDHVGVTRSYVIDGQTYYTFGDLRSYGVL